jgi:addiction module HigA family antidote
MLKPPHPGEFIRTEIIEPLGLSVTRAAQVLGVSRPVLSSLLNGKTALSGEMALRIEKAFGPKYRPAQAMQALVGSRKNRSEFRDPVEYVRGLRRGSRIERLSKQQQS